MTPKWSFWTPFLTPSEGFWAKGYEIPMESKGILRVLAGPAKTAQKGGPKMTHFGPFWTPFLDPF